MLSGVAVGKGWRGHEKEGGDLYDEIPFVVVIV